MGRPKSWWSLWTTGLDTPEEIRKATQAATDKETIKAKELWAWAQTDPASAADYMASMSHAAGVDAHIKLTMRLIAELTAPNDNRTRNQTRRPASRTKSKHRN